MMMGRKPKLPDRGSMTPFGRRLHDLMQWLDKDQTALARLVGVEPATINRALHGSRGTSEDGSRAIIMGAQQRLRIPPEFWVDVARPPSDFLDATGVPVSPNMGTAPMFATTYEDPRYVFARASAANQDPPQIAAELLTVEAPHDAPWAWWLAFYMAAVKRHANR